MRATALALFALVPLALASNARASEWTLDPEHTEIGFSVRHMMVTDVRGAFEKYSGTITVDDKDVTKSSVAVEIDVASVNTKVVKRDNHLRSPEFFDVAKFPKMTFKATKIEKGATASALKVTGDLTLHGVTKPVALDVALSDEWQDPKEWGGRTHRGVKATAKINRQDFGVNWQTKLDRGGVVAGDEVTIMINAELIRK
ncbi:MAG: protein yceI precursor [Deltaproteobacteria bacterium RBG_16_71_12]|nr:MAG: protein yceI precursor [Deltaproteobacteria bacterium RBG_16_71_12]